MPHSSRRPGRSCETVGIFTNLASLEAAVDELLLSGFDSVELSIGPSNHTNDEALRRLCAKVSRHARTATLAAVQGQIKRGAVPLWARASNAYDAARAGQIMSKRFARDVHVEELPATIFKRNKAETETPS